MKTPDLIGKRFGSLTVLEKTDERRNGEVVWKCVCDCGRHFFPKTSGLMNGRNIRCHECAQEVAMQKAKARRKHGGAGTRIYRIYYGMRGRVTNSNRNRYKDYGERGITITDEWLGEHGFEHFRDWAMANGYADNLTIERIDVNKGYCPENCTWIPLSEQCNNTRRTRRIEYNGETHTAAEWERITGINHKTLARRIDSGKYTVEEAFTIIGQRRIGE